MTSFGLGDNMFQYTRGYVRPIIPEQKALVIELSGCKHNCPKCKNIKRQESGQPLTDEVIKYIIGSFKKYVDVICLVGGEEDQRELKNLCKLFHKEGFKTALSTAYPMQSMLNKALVEELDFILYGRCDQEQKIEEHTFDPFDDCYTWCVVSKNTNI